MSHIAISRPTARRREKGTLLLRVLNWCIRLLPYLKLPGYFPPAFSHIARASLEAAHVGPPRADAEKPRTR